MEVVVGYEKEFNLYIDCECVVVKFFVCVGELLYDKGIELVLFRNYLIDVIIFELLNFYEYVKNVVCKLIDVEIIVVLVEELFKMDFVLVKIDIGKLVSEWIVEKE